jgi:hypothetical protein
MNKKTVLIVVFLLAVLSIVIAYVVLNGYFSPTHDVAIVSVTVSTTEVHLGDVINVTVVARNKGTSIETFNVTLYINGTVKETHVVADLAAGSERTFSSSWNTTDSSLANYVLKAEADAVSGESNVVDNTCVSGVVKVRSRSTGSATLFVDPASNVESVGQDFVVKVNVSNVFDLYGWEIKFRWNVTVLGVVNVTEGAFLKSSGNTFFTYGINNTEGVVIVDCTLIGDLPGTDGNGTLMIVQFHVKEVGSCYLSPYDTILLSSFELSLNHTASSGSFTTP